MKNSKTIIFVEDPGAANFIYDVPGLLQRNGIDSIIFARGPALNFLSYRNIEFAEVENITEIVEILNREIPQLVLVGTSQNPKSPGLKLIDYAKEKQIESIGFVDMEVDSHLRFCGLSNSPLKHAPDWLVVPDEITKNSFVELNFNPEKIVITGYPNYERLQQLKGYLQKTNTKAVREALFPDLKDKKVLTYISEHSNNDDPRIKYNSKYAFTGRGTSNSRTRIILEEIIAICNRLDNKPYLVVRLHPKNDISEFQEYRNDIDKFSISEDPISVIWYSDFIIGMTSMLVMEAMALDKPVVSVLPMKEEKDWSIHTRYGYVPCIYNRNELSKVLSDYFDSDTFVKSPHNFLNKQNPHNNVLTFIISRLKNESISKN